MPTTRHEITSGQYVQVSTGPCFVELVGRGTGRVVLNDTQPEISAIAYHEIRKGEHFSSGSDETVWVGNTTSFPIVVMVS